MVTIVVVGKSIFIKYNWYYNFMGYSPKLKYWR